MKWLIPENEIDIQQREFLDSLITNTNQKLIDGFPGSVKPSCFYLLPKD